MLESSDVALREKLGWRSERAGQRLIVDGLLARPASRSDHRDVAQGNAFKVP